MKDVHLLALRQRVDSRTRNIKAIKYLGAGEIAAGKYDRYLTIIFNSGTG